MFFKSRRAAPCGTPRLAREAQACRKTAAEFSDGPEQLMLLKIARVFDELANNGG